MKEQVSPLTRNKVKDNTGKVPPQNIELEETVLGGMLLETRSIEDVIQVLSPDVFYKDSHKTIFATIDSMYRRNEPIDLLTVTSQLRKDGKLDSVGGAYYITLLTSRIASSANIAFHASILNQYFIKRETIRLASELHEMAYTEAEDPFDIISYADNEISKINEFSTRGGSLTHISNATSKAVTEAKNRDKMARTGKSTGISTGIKSLDRLTGGWRKSDLVIIAARPGMGKTALMLHFAKSAGIAGTPVCIYSLEMSDVSLANRMILSCCDVNPNTFKKGYMTPEDWNEVAKAETILNKLPIYIDPNPSVSMRYIKANSRVMAKKGQCGIIMIDYLQLADVSTNEKNRNREQEIAQASRQAKILAKELNVPVILLSQLNRAAESRKESKPMLSDLRESGAIEQDADMVAFAYRPEYYGINEDAKCNSLKGVGMLLVQKHRDGPTEDVFFRYNENLTKIGDLQSDTPF